MVIAVYTHFSYSFHFIYLHQVLPFSSESSHSTVASNHKSIVIARLKLSVETSIWFITTNTRERQKAEFCDFIVIMTYWLQFSKMLNHMVPIFRLRKKLSISKEKTWRTNNRWQGMYHLVFFAAIPWKFELIAHRLFPNVFASRWKVRILLWKSTWTVSGWRISHDLNSICCQMNIVHIDDDFVT